MRHKTPARHTTGLHTRKSCASRGYDALGKLLHQRPLPPGTTIQEVDLSRFGKGTYVIKCTDPEGVSYERVVVE